MAMNGRVPVGLQLKPGKDSDLIEWWNSLSGDRSAALKAVLRAGLGLQAEQEGAQEPDELDTLRHQVAVMTEQMTHYQQWFEYIDRHIQAGRMGEPAPQPEESQAVDDEAQEKMNKRADKWKKRW